jgi:hypothetical protein
LGRVGEVLDILAYTSSQISWQLILSAISRAQTSSGDILKIDLNLEALPSIVLSCVALEAFVNEVSSLTYAFLFECEQENVHLQNIDMYEKIAEIRNSNDGNFYQRYKRLLKILEIEHPTFREQIFYLKEVRDMIVHFKTTDIPIVDDGETIRAAQSLPEELNALKKFKINNYPIIASDGKDGSVEWPLKVSTSAMAAWSITLVLDAIIYSLDAIPNKELKDFIVKKYATYDEAFPNLFQQGKATVKRWTKELYDS